jgi:hypothetical protein
MCTTQRLRVSGSVRSLCGICAGFIRVDMFPWAEPLAIPERFCAYLHGMTSLGDDIYVRTLVLR